MSSGSERCLLLSIRPHFAEAIMEGRKTIELRRTRPRVEPGSQVILYASAPRMAVVAQARVVLVLEDDPASIWREHQDQVGISATVFLEYFEGVDTAYGLQLEDVTPLDPFSLKDLRALGVEPPQSWRYLDPQVVEQISAGTPS